MHACLTVLNTSITKSISEILMKEFRPGLDESVLGREILMGQDRTKRRLDRYQMCLYCPVRS